MRFFFYGTLLDCDVTAVVLGRRLPPSAFVPATLPGHVRRRVKGGSYPIVLPNPRGEVPGAVVSGLSARDVARLSAYEGPRYRIGALNVKVAGRVTRVSIFEPIENRFQPVDGEWDLVAWQRRDKRAFLARVRRALSVLPAYSRR